MLEALFLQFTSAERREGGLTVKPNYCLKKQKTEGLIFQSLRGTRRQCV